MSPLRFRDDDSHLGSTVAAALAGAVAGFAVGMVVAQRVGGFSGLRARIRRVVEQGSELEAARHGAEVGEYYDYDEYEEYDEDEIEEEAADRDEELEERVLEAFRNDPILSERAVDIGSLGPGIVELAGWVETEDEAEHAVTLARGVPDVETVVNRLAIGDREEAFADAARRVREGDPALTEARWEGVRVGTGRRRQGTSDEADRHADPAVHLEERWLDTPEALRNAADDTGGVAERRARGGRRPPRGDRTGGAPVAPTGVPKGDHVANPEEAKEL